MTSPDFISIVLFSLLPYTPDSMTADLEKASSKADDKMGEAQLHETTGNVVDSELARDAQAGADAEKSMTLWQGLRAYPKAVGWSVAISMATTMDGYDTGFLGSLLGLVCHNHSHPIAPCPRRWLGTDADFVVVTVLARL